MKLVSTEVDLCFRFRNPSRIATTHSIRQAHLTLERKTEEARILEEKHRAIEDQIEFPQLKRPYSGYAIGVEDELGTFYWLKDDNPTVADERHDLTKEQPFFPPLTNRYQLNTP